MPLPDGKPARLLVVTAHPVDAFDNTGGTCAEHIAQGDTVTALICTSGVYIHNERLADELRKPEAERDPKIMNESADNYAARKKEEAEKSLGCFGITDVIVLPYDDDEFDPRMEKDIAEVIRDRRPHIILQQDPTDGPAGTDLHSQVGAATCRAMGKAATARYGDPNPPWYVPEVYWLGVFGANVYRSGNLHRQVDVFVEVTKHYEAKVRAHQFIATQGQHVGWGQKRFESIEGHLGIFAGVSYAEAYIRVSPPVYDTLPVAKKRYEDLKLPSAESSRKNQRLLGAFVPEADGSYTSGFVPKQ